jgi:glutamyl-tRNA synthetase
MSNGRFAPSPSGDLHVGNLRTALLAWLFARSTDRGFLIRVEDLDRVRPGAEEQQLDDLRSLGIDWDGEIVRQSDRRARYVDAIDHLIEADRVYPCFCSRREIRDAPSAPHTPPGTYPGTCRDLTGAERARRAAERPAALRLRADTDAWTIEDALHGTFTGNVDDLVLRRNDGVPAYNLAVVVDDAAQDVDQVVRGDDLLTSAPSQAYLATLLGHDAPTYAHVPLVLNTSGQRLAKRDGAVTRTELESRGVNMLALIAESMGLVGATPTEMLATFDPARLPRDPWTFVPLA